VLDLAVAVIIGAAFGKIVTGLVEGIIMPPIGLLFGKLDFANLFVDLSGTHPASLDAAKKSRRAGHCLRCVSHDVIVFLIIALVVFLIVKQANRLKKVEVAEPATKPCPRCLTTIPLAATRCSGCCAELGPA